MAEHLAPKHDRRGCLLLIFGSWIVWGALTVAAYWWVTH